MVHSRIRKLLPTRPINTDEEETTIEVNHQALVNILTRYPGPFDVFRELIQNADDAEAQTIQIHFETEKSGAATTSTNVDISKVKVRKWIIKNDGKPLRDEDWGRLRKIAEGNRNSSKVGAFGVGFYIVLSVCDKPLVKSNGRCLKMTRGKELRVKMEPYTPDAQDAEMTSIELNLKPDVPDPLPKLADLARFLVSSITFLEKIHTIKVFLDERPLVCIKKTITTLPSTERFENTPGILVIRSIDRAVQHVTVHAVQQAFPKELSVSEADGGDKETALLPQGSLVCDMTKESAITVAYDLYTAQVQANPPLEMKNSVESLMKALPEQFLCKVVYFNSKQNKAVVESDMSHFFRGSHGILPDSNNGRIFIGQSTRQNTGIGLHIGSHFLPTVERGTVDLTNGQVAVWNEAVFKVAGSLARVVHEQEMERAQKSDSDQMKIGLYTMKQFAFEGKADDRVSKHLKDGFFLAPDLRVLTTTGVSSVTKVRKRSAPLSFLRSYLFLSDDISKHHRDLLAERCDIRKMSLKDLVDEFASGVSEDQILAFFSWWKSPGREVKSKEGLFEKLCSEGRFRLNGEDIMIKDIKQYTLVTAEKDLLPSDTLYVPESLVPVLDQFRLFGWVSFGTLRWLEHCGKLLQHHGGREKEVIGHRVFSVLTGPRGISYLPKQDRGQAKKFLESVECIRTDKGMKKPSESYFTVAGILEDLPVVDDKILSKEVLQALEDLGVHRSVDWDTLLSRLELDTKADTNVRFLRYLVDVKGTGMLDNHIEDLKKRKVFASECHGRLVVTELYRPDVLNGKLRELGLPILDLSPGGSINIDIGDMLELLGTRKYPPLQKIIGWLSGPDSEDIKGIARECLQKHKEGYRKEAMEAMGSSGASISATIAEELAAPHRMVWPSSWIEPGFDQISDSLQNEELLLEVLGMKEESPAAMLLDFLNDCLPEMEMAGLLERLKSHDLCDLSDIQFVPTRLDLPHFEYKRPRDCFVSSDPAPGHLIDILPIVNFGERGNRFLVKWGAKAGLPQALDIAQEMAKDPGHYLQRLGNDFERYRRDLKDIAAKFDTFPDYLKQSMRAQPMLLAICKREDSLHYNELRLATNIFISRDKGNLYDFGRFAFVAPEGLEALYRKLGSELLDNCVHQVNRVHALDESEYSYLRFSRECILQCAECFTSDELVNGRQSDVSVDDLRVKYGLQIKLCSKVELVKMYVPPSGHLPEEGLYFDVPTGSTVNAAFEPESYTIWVGKKAERDAMLKGIADALCSLLLKEHSPRDALIMKLFLADTEGCLEYATYGKPITAQDISHQPNIVLTLRGLDQLDMNMGRADEKYSNQSLSFFGSPASGSRSQESKHKSGWRNMVASLGTNGHEYDPIQWGKDALHSLMKEPPLGQSSNTRHLACASKKDTRCKSVCIERQPDNNLERFTIKFYWDRRSQSRKFDPEALRKFAELVYDLGLRVFQVNHSATFSIIWNDKDQDLMGFNRDQERIFLNLAHYYKHHYKTQAQEEKVVTDWYFILAHEIAHNKSLHHDVVHETAFAGLCVRHLGALYEYYPSCEEYVQSGLCSETANATKLGHST